MFDPDAITVEIIKDSDGNYEPRCRVYTDKIEEKRKNEMFTIIATGLFILFVIAVTTLLIAGGMFLNGLALHYLWLWFLTPLGLPGIGIAHAIGICILVGLLTIATRKSEFISNETKKEKRYRDTAYLACWVVKPLMALLLGYIIHIYFM